jgi:hypothetical protein
MVAGIFGMNLRSTLEMSVVGFWGTTAMIVLGAYWVSGLLSWSSGGGADSFALQATACRCMMCWFVYCPSGDHPAAA